MFEAARTILIDGGWVMSLLLALSLLAGTLVVERCWFWFQNDRPQARARVDEVMDRVRDREFRSARELAARGGDVASVYAREMLTRSRRLGGAGASENGAHELVERARPAFERFAPTLSTVITAAPMLGILGTVVGIITSFRLLGGGGPIDDPTAVAGGIATALYTTAFGLVIALGALFPYAIFRARADRLIGRLETIAALVIEHDERSGEAHGGAVRDAEGVGGKAQPAVS